MRQPTAAQQIAARFADYDDATNEADRIAMRTDQDWENETTVFTFADGSQLKACHPFIEVVA